jgi:predicted kinase
MLEITPQDTGKVLIATVGLPRSGKTTFCKAYHQKYGAPIVNPDSIRLAIHNHRFITEAEDLVWATAHIMVRSLFLAGNNIVLLDSCNCSEKRRLPWITKNFDTVFINIDTDKETCIQRAGEDVAIVPVINRMADNGDDITHKHVVDYGAIIDSQLDVDAFVIDVNEYIRRLS